MLGAANNAWPSRILMTGGHTHIRGGLEIFMARARACLGIEGFCYTDTPGRGWRSAVHYLAGLWRFSRLLKAYDIIWLHYGSAFDLGYLVLAKLAGKKVAVTPHLGRDWRTMRIGASRALCNRLLSTADVVFTLYSAQPIELEFPHPLKSRCTAMGTFLPKAMLDSSVARPAHGGALRLIHLARLSMAKGSFAFLAVCEELRARSIPFEASIAGPADRSVLQALQTQISRKNLPVTILGDVAPDAVLDLLRRHDVLVNLSLQDAYPLTVIEALLCGVVPVCSRLRGTEELAGETQAVRLVDGQDPKRAADSILAINTRDVAQGAALMRQKFAWADLTRRYRTAFSSLARGSVCSTNITKAMPQ